MDAYQIQLVQNSFKQVVPIADTAANLFYTRLFELDPTLRPLFKGNMKQQGVKLMRTLQIAVNALNDLEAIIPELQALAHRHVTYGVQDAHYATVGEALLWTLEQGLGAEFTAEVEEAWQVTYGLLSNVMREAANPN